MASLENFFCLTPNPPWNQSPSDHPQTPSDHLGKYIQPEALLSQRGRAMLRVCIASIQNVERSVLLLVVSASDIPLRTIKFFVCFPWGRPWGNHAKRCMNGKRIRCLQIVSLHVPIYL